MAIAPSQRLGPYEILSLIGVGGMGEVYRARDTRLDRTVAIKVLPDHLAVRADLRKRFEREARPNGKELFFREGDEMMVVDITAQPSFSAGKPKMLFQGNYVPTPLTFPNYDVSPDGQRFLMIKPDAQSNSLNQIVLVQNWFEELKQKVSAGGK